MNFKKMEVLTAIAELQNITKAAQYLGVKQPTVTFHMKSLEKDVNTTLFQHQGGKIILTEEGNALLFYAERILNLSKDAKDTMRFLKSSAGYEMKIGSSMVPAIHILPDIIAAVKERYLLSRISVTVMPAPEIQKKLRDYEISFGIVSSNEFLLEDLQYEELQYQELCTDKMVLVYSSENTLSRKQEIKREDLINQSFVLHGSNTTTRKLTDKWADDIGLKINPFLEISSIEAIIKAVKNNLGISILSELSVKEEAESGILGYSYLPEYSPSRNIYIIYNKDRYMPEILKKFIDFLIAWPYENQSAAQHFHP